MLQNGCQSQNKTEQNVSCMLGEFARITGVDETKLSRYQELGLLSACASASGSGGVYTRHHLIQLERIAFMKLLGISTLTMRNALCSEITFTIELRRQQEVVKELRKRLDHLMYFLQIAEELNRCQCTDDWHYVGQVIDSLEQLSRLEGCLTLYLNESSEASPIPSSQTPPRIHKTG